MHVVGTEYDIDVASAPLDQVAVLLGQAAPYRQLDVWTGVLERLQVAQGAVELVVGVLSDTARVEDNHVGLILGGRRN